MTATTPNDSSERAGRGLERDLVVRSALQLLDDVGFSGLTLRRLAGCLKVKAAALYWHFENKQDLIDAMAEQIMQDEFAGMRPPGKGWRDLLTMVAVTHRKALLRHRDGAQIMAHANMRQSTMLEGMELLLQALESQGFTSELAIGSFFTVIRYTLGCVFEEQADPRSREVRLAERAKHWQVMVSKYPTIAKSFSEVMAKTDRYPDRMFERGLGIILDGIEHQLPKAA